MKYFQLWSIVPLLLTKHNLMQSFVRMSVQMSVSICEHNSLVLTISQIEISLILHKHTIDKFRNIGLMKYYWGIFSCFVSGPSVAYDINWMTGFEVIRLAVESMESGECDAAIVGASNLSFFCEFQSLYNEMELISPDGSTRAFDANGNCFGRFFFITCQDEFWDSERCSYLTTNLYFYHQLSVFGSKYSFYSFFREFFFKWQCTFLASYQDSFPEILHTIGLLRKVSEINVFLS